MTLDTYPPDWPQIAAAVKDTAGRGGVGHE